MANQCLGIKLLSDDAIVPTKAHDQDAGYDLYALEDVVIPRGECLAVRTGVAVVLPDDGTYGRIAPRSSVSLKNVFVNGGVVDSSYTGELRVILSSFSSDFHVEKGNKIAQLILERIETPPVVRIDTLPETSRGDAGFGSTGR